MKKKLIALFAVCAIVLTACSNENTSSEVTSAPETTTSAPETTTSAEETTPEAPIETLPDDNAEAPIADSNAKALADVVLNAVEWPMMGEQTDAFMISDYFGIDTTLTEDFCIQQNMMSTHLNEVIIIKPSDGNMEAIKTALNAHLDKLRNEVAFYPMQAESAEAAIVNEHNGYAYLICHTEAVTAEEALTAAIDAL